MILIVDDDKAIRQSLVLLLKRKGYETATAGNQEEALAIIRSSDLELIIMDMNYSLSTTGEEGIHLLRQTKIYQPDTPVILITAWGSIELAVEGMRFGAFDFITKPWNNRLLLQRVETAINLSRNEPENGEQDDTGSRDFNRCGFIGRNPRILELMKTVERIAPTDAPVLILGENGTGKELVANAIHANSRRKSEPFVMVNLGGISTSLFESEMFGHSKGAFTGAVNERKGRFEIADKGTIFLDEIGDLGADCQVKLLRVLQQHTFERLGESKPRKTDIRAICATNADLPQMVRERTFREDLFYRINLITLRIPPLRERRDDIPLLVDHFVSQSCSEHGLSKPGVSKEAIEYLCTLPFPGNVRQLKNMVERAVLMCQGDELTKSDFEAEGSAQENKSQGIAGATLEQLEKTAVVEALKAYDGNLSKAARSLGITRQALYRKIEKYELGTDS